VTRGWLLVRFRIAGLDLTLQDTSEVLAELDQLYAEFEARGREHAADAANPHLCRAGCSACCRSGAFFAVTLVEALRLAGAVEKLPAPFGARARADALQLLKLQSEVFALDADAAGEPDVPGARDEATFTARVARVASRGPCCPLLEGDLCSIYADRPFLCRAYGFPVDAFAVETESAIAFRSLCHLYEGLVLRDYVRARDLRDRLATLSTRLAGGVDLGRFTSPEAILAETSVESA
jgi:Fe-S-cluster containining protein